MDQFFTNPGLCHIGEQIIQELDYDSLFTCAKVCQTWKKIIENKYLNDPNFWLNTCIHQSPKCVEIRIDIFQASQIHIDQWNQLIQASKNTNLEAKTLNLLKNMHQNEIQTSFKPPLFMALKLKDFDLVRSILMNYTNQFLAKEESKNESFYEQISSNHSELIDYVIKYIMRCIEEQNRSDESRKNKDTWQFFGAATEFVRRNTESLKYYLLYVICNYPEELFGPVGGWNSRYTFLYYILWQPSHALSLTTTYFDQFKPAGVPLQ